MNVYERDWEKKKKQKQKMKPRKRFSPFGCPPILPSTKWRLTIFRCVKTSRTYPRGERDPSLMGQKAIQGWVRCGQLDYREYELYTCELSRSSTTYISLTRIYCLISLIVNKIYFFSFIFSYFFFTLFCIFRYLFFIHVCNSSI